MQPCVTSKKETDPLPDLEEHLTKEKKKKRRAGGNSEGRKVSMLTDNRP